MKVSLFEISYKKKYTFSRHSNLLRCTCTDFRVVPYLYDFLLQKSKENILKNIGIQNTLMIVEFHCLDKTHLLWDISQKQPQENKSQTGLEWRVWVNDDRIFVFG